tara:strand:+ start:162 stop:509 length:348 start_codon:yes stop_codon:yes gene_type:complete
MATAKQILANKKNARRSTGPKTMLGKDKVSMNALKEEENNNSDELEKYQEMRRLQRETDLKKLREEADTKVDFSKPMRQDPNRGMYFIKNFSLLNRSKLGSSRMFLKDIKVESYY